MKKGESKMKKGESKMKELNEQEKFWLAVGPAYTSGGGTESPDERLNARPKFFRLFESLGNKDLSILEVGCNRGMNLSVLDSMGFKNLSGIDIVESAVSICQQNLPDADIRQGSILSLPWEDEQFDVVFSAGVLIHQHRTESLPVVMDEMARCAKSNILGLEDYNSISAAKNYRGRNDQYWAAPYDRFWKERFPQYDMVTRQMEGIRVVYRIDK